MVNVGIGASDPMQKIAKIQAAADTTGKVLAPWIENGQLQGKVEPNVREIINEVFGAAGFQDGGDRFFIIHDDPNQPPQQPQQPPDPTLAKAKIDQETKLKTKGMEVAAKLKIAGDDRQAKAAGDGADRQQDGFLAKLKAGTEIGKIHAQHESKARLAAQDHAHQAAHEHASRKQDATEAQRTRAFEMIKQIAQTQAAQEQTVMKSESAEKMAKMKGQQKPKAKAK